MATEIYKSENIILVDDTELYLTPLKIKYLREFMDEFDNLKEAKDQDEALNAILKCVLITMKQYCPAIKTIEDLEDAISMPDMYRILDISAGINIDPEKEKPVQEQANAKENNSWENLDLAKLEAEVFLLGIWKDYEELESSLSMPELVATLESKRELDYAEKKFLAAIQGVDLDKQTGKDKENPWEKMKAKVFSGGKTDNPNDIVAYSGANAQKAGFGIGMGLSYERIG